MYITQSLIKVLSRKRQMNYLPPVFMFIKIRIVLKLHKSK
jgi:hypothetical protein